MFQLSQNPHIPIIYHGSSTVNLSIIVSLLALSPVFFFCSLVCVQYNTQKRKRWKSGEKRGGPGNTYVKPSPKIVYGTLFDTEDSIKSGLSPKVITILHAWIV